MKFKKLSYFQRGKNAMADGSGESPEVARHIELRDMIAANHLEVTNAITGVTGLVSSHGEKLEAHANEDRENFAAQVKTSKELKETLKVHMDTCPGEKPKRNWKGISVAVTAAGTAVAGMFKWLGPDS